MHQTPELLPADRHNQRLISQVHPPDWVNPTPDGRYNLVVVGAGTAGLVSAAGAAGLGAKVALVERHLMGGDCLNVGCVPSKTLIKAAHAVHQARKAERFGVRVPGEVDIDFQQVMERVRRIRADISPNDSARRFADEYGVDIFLGEGRFVSDAAVEVDGSTLPFDRAVIATGARAVTPPIPGLAESGFHTNETIFNLRELPVSLAVIGGGPIGCELAQAFGRLGSRVTVIEQGSQFLPREDPDASAILSAALEREGIDVRLGTTLERVAATGNEQVLTVSGPDGTTDLRAAAILISVGRRPNVEGLGLEAAGVQFDRSGVTVDDTFRTSNRAIYSAGDVCSAYKFTHAADFMARAVIQNAFFGLVGKKRAGHLTIPWCTYTDPEIARIGLNEAQARSEGVEVTPYTVNLSDVDRAVTEGETEGFVRILVKRGTDRILGATIVGRDAGDLISEVGVAMSAKVGLGTLASVIHPYPTRAEAIRKAGDLFNRTRLTEWRAKLLSKYFAWRR